MGWPSVCFDVAIVAYALSLSLLFSDVVHPSRVRNRTAVAMLFTAFVAMTTLLFLRLSRLPSAIDYSKSDLSLLVSWLMLTVTLVVDARFRIGVVVFFANVVSFGLALFAGGLQADAREHWLPAVNLLIVHIALATLGEAAFAFAFAFALMHLVQERRLRQHRFDRWFLQLPSLATLDTWALFASAVGCALMLLAMATGSFWGDLVLHRWLLLWPKFIATAVCWAMYVIYLGLRIVRRAADRRLMFYQVVCFVALLFNLFLVSGRTPAGVA
ncbi:hypothetical protein Heshes_14960 [Alicyclobacillus hesperidum]|uniref:Cytochrome c assembly protein domain-containing protein n=1 Tax=Alicyclobacillus hesperidum TaxID=89784 RepID=A0AA37U8E8_9BACL|nr:cytochrome c biogenesis protein CcsA [Alicyclobacillus hesperidum]GLV13812.1 hypothetical protein Heshes_14960 [Alicyclobacillus hesperidum]